MWWLCNTRSFIELLGHTASCKAACTCSKGGRLTDLCLCSHLVGLEQPLDTYVALVSIYTYAT